MILNRNSQIVATEPPKPVQYAISALQRDKKAVFTETGMPGGDIVLAKDSDLPPECFCLQVHEDRLMLTSAAVSMYTVCLKSVAVFWVCSPSGSGTIRNLSRPMA